MSAACFLAAAGHKVTVLEKNAMPGGRAAKFEKDGFLFDMGPSWYWMPDVFERFFANFNTTPADHYSLQRLDPSYRVFWQNATEDIPATFGELKTLFDDIEPGAGTRLEDFLTQAAEKYKISMEKLVYRPSLSLSEYINTQTLSSLLRLDLFSSVHKHVRKYFSDQRLLQLVEFPILFLGALPQNTPSLYTLMNHADITLGTWYPSGGMYKVVEGIYRLALSLGVEFSFQNEVLSMELRGTSVSRVITARGEYDADSVIASCDYQHAEQLLPQKYRNYSNNYWQSRKMSPSALVYYIGLNKKVDALQHHNLFFDASFTDHANALYSNPAWPADPLMYVCCPSRTDETVAPAGGENLFILIPTPPGLQDTPGIRDQYFDIAIQRIEKRTGANIRENIVLKRSYAHNDFIADYHSFKGNAYGLANTLGQTAILKPSIRNKKVKNLWYAGQLTVPGPGLPPALISGEIVARQVLKNIQKKAIAA